MQRRTGFVIRTLLCGLLTIGLALSAPATKTVSAADLVLDISGRAFTVNGVAKFLVFVSYFDALDQSSTNRASDFSQLKAHGVDGIRIFPNWWGLASAGDTNYHFAQDTLMTSTGTLRSSRIDNFLNTLDAAKAAGLVVDVVFSAETVRTCSSTCYKANVSGTLDRSELKSAAVAIATLLANGGSKYKHVMYDIQNEANQVGPSDGKWYPNATLVDEVAEAIHAVDPYRPITISLTESVGAAGAANFADSAELDAANWHNRHVTSFWTYTDGDVDAARAATTKPIYLSEPEKSGDSHWTLPGIQQDLREAKSHGAAAWCFHTRASFYLHSGRTLYSGLNSSESTFLQQLASVKASVSWGI